MQKLTGPLIVIGTACLAIAAGLTFREAQKPNISPAGYPPIPIWLTQSDKSSIRGVNSIFSIKAALVSPQEILFFYVMQSPLGDMPTYAGVQSTDFTKADTLGKIGEFNIGVISVPWSDQPGQELTLQVALPGESKSALIAPLKQIGPSSKKPGVDFLPISSEPSTVKLELGSLGGESNYAILKLSLSDQSGISPVFFRVDRKATVFQITEAEFNALVPSGISTQNSDPGMVTPAPLEKP